MNKRSIFLSAIIAFSAIGWLGFNQDTVGSPEQPEGQVTRVFAVENMTCAACPITVKKAMARVDGVESVEVDLKAKTATAVFDPDRASCMTIAQASTEVGFPAKLMKEGEHEQDC
jgi:mercuric ion binding protein